MQALSQGGYYMMNRVLYWACKCHRGNNMYDLDNFKKYIFTSSLELRDKHIHANVISMDRKRGRMYNTFDMDNTSEVICIIKT